MDWLGGSVGGGVEPRDAAVRIERLLRGMMVVVRSGKSQCVKLWSGKKQVEVGVGMCG